MAKTNIFKEAKKLRAAHPRKYKTWAEYVQAAGSKHKRTPKKTVMHKNRSTVARKPRRRPAAGSGISTRSKSHTDNNRQRTYITIGSVRKDTAKARKKLETLIGQQTVKIFKATKKAMKRKLSKKLSAMKSQYRRLAM